MPVPAFRRLFLYAGSAVIGGILLVAAIVPPLSAQNNGLIAEGFQTSETNLSAGALMSLKQNNANTVELANTDRASRLVGVVGTGAFLDVSDEKSGVQVVMSGTATALVSDLNGVIKTGDRITVSPIAGVGAKATQSGVVLGTAQAALDLSKADTRTVTDTNGRQSTVHIGLIPVQINVSAYFVASSTSGGVPAALQNFANGIAGKPVSPLRIFVAALLIVLLFATVVTLLYSAVQSSVISIGRNPLSEHALRKTVVQVGLLVLGITVLGLVLVYLILKL